MQRTCHQTLLAPDSHGHMQPLEGPGRRGHSLEIPEAILKEKGVNHHIRAQRQGCRLQPQSPSVFGQQQQPSEDRLRPRNIGSERIPGHENSRQEEEEQPRDVDSGGDRGTGLPSLSPQVPGEAPEQQEDAPFQPHPLPRGSPHQPEERCTMACEGLIRRDGERVPTVSTEELTSRDQAPWSQAGGCPSQDTRISVPDTGARNPQQQSPLWGAQLKTLCASFRAPQSPTTSGTGSLEPKRAHQGSCEFLGPRAEGEHPQGSSCPAYALGITASLNRAPQLAPGAQLKAAIKQAERER
ncbi:hypothetical protein UY3_05897 [Chelonia mydas]|uniref:Uncharacterized protein n=1 Tax=Chelonia mydas TaxID=8469 RepID=M7C8L6_CHEMY|nr:hypothetical protein UY3_05897 [Chelonia mydas]